MSHSVIRCPFTFAKPQVRFDGHFKDIKGDLLVLWYGTFTPNRREKTVPLVNVHFRTVDRDGSLGAFYSVPMGLPYLSYFKVGTVWREGAIHSDTQLETLAAVTVDFSPDKWRFVTASQAGLTSVKSPYKLPLSADTWLVEFRTGTEGQTVLVPCVELLIRLYGRSSETSRILTTYPWNEVQSRFFFDRDETWPTNVVKLQRSVRESEAVFLAHLRHDEYTKLRSKKLYSDLEAEFKSKQDAIQCFGNLQVAPWFIGPAQIRGSGHWIDSNTFLCLRLTGSSEPMGPELEIHRAEYETQDLNPEDDDGGLFIKRPTKMLPLDQQVELTNDHAPDTDAGTYILLSESFEVLGQRRPTSRYFQRKPGERGQKVVVTDNSDVLSAGDPNGRGSGNGKAEIVDMEPWESSGVLVDVWKALKGLQKSFSTVIKTVEWVTLDDQSGTQPPVKLVPVKEFEKDENATPEQRAWVYLDVKRKIVRGVQILRIVCGNRQFYLFEFQRRPVNVDGKPSEQKARALLTELSISPKLAEIQIKKILNLMRLYNGAFRDFVDNLEGPSVTFKHTKYKADEILHFTCLKNKFIELGVNFPKASPSKAKKDGRDQAPNT
ncbi:hypothetical protein [Pseudomonas sp. PP3]|uniref:hypothetical protein n=1 Tax=Pseudomonas sp. PP3 TaxID=2815936 RepID=UPI001BAF163C|nr:hypothetical protein [Pseudomonas sp. PP3]